MKKTLPFTKEQIENIIHSYPTPWHLYDEKGIRENCRKFLRAFTWAKDFTEYFAVKALPNPHVLQIFREEGCGVDCSSLPELLLAEKVGFKGEKIMFTYNDTPYQEYQKARELGAIINLDDITHIAYLEKYAGIPKTLSFRYNPGGERTGNGIIGKPLDAKYGLTKKQLFTACKLAREKGVKRFGLHTMIASNELNPQYFIQTAQMLFTLVLEITQKIGIRFTFINFGGGMGIPYKLDQKPLDITKISREIQEIYKYIIVKNRLDPLRLCFENGRMMTGTYGFLVTKVIHTKNTYKNYLGVDACMANLMRPGIYGAYHHITALGKENKKHTKTYDVVGSLCENNDKFAIDRKLPEISIEDLLVIHDTGAHGHAMGFNYNGKLRSAELLLQQDGKVRCIRRAETISDYFATLDFSTFRKKGRRQ
jgi:diaminopimelate decarboxylase